jgi:hypothetical protein
MERGGTIEHTGFVAVNGANLYYEVVIERAGHMANLDRPRATTRELLRFLRQP